MDTVKEEERGSERGRERGTDGGQGEGVAALAADGAQERRRQRKRATQHAIRVGWDKPGKEGERRQVQELRLGTVGFDCSMHTPHTHTHTSFLPPPRCPPHIYCIVALVRIVPVRITPMERLCSVQRNWQRTWLSPKQQLHRPPPSFLCHTHTQCHGGICIEWPW